MQPGFKLSNLCLSSLFLEGPLLPTSFQEWQGSKKPTGASCQHPFSGGRRFWDEGHQLLSSTWFVNSSPAVSKNSKALASRSTHHPNAHPNGQHWSQEPGFSMQFPVQAFLSSQGSENCTREADAWALIYKPPQRPPPLTPAQTPNSWVSGGMFSFWPDSNPTV